MASESDCQPWEGRSLPFLVLMVEDELQQRQKKRAEGSQCQDKLEGVHRITCLSATALVMQRLGPGVSLPGLGFFGARGRQPGQGRPLSFFFEIRRLSPTPAISGRFRPFFSPGSRVSCDAGGFGEAGRAVSETLMPRTGPHEKNCCRKNLKMRSGVH